MGRKMRGRKKGRGRDIGDGGGGMELEVTLGGSGGLLDVNRVGGDVDRPRSGGLDEGRGTLLILVFEKFESFCFNCLFFF